MKLCVDPVDFLSAAEVIGSEFADDVADIGDDLIAALSDTARVAGHDPAGASWATAYDAASGPVVQAIFDLSDAGIQTAALLQQSGFNHAMADEYSNLTGIDLVTSTATYSAGTRRSVTIPSAEGGGMADLPEGWELVQSALGLMWPDGDPGKLRAMGDAWRSAGNLLDGTIGTVASGDIALEFVESPEIDDARIVLTSLSESAADLAAQARTIGDACTDLATAIDDTRSEIVKELAIMLAAIVLIELGAAAVAVPTAGVGTVGMQGLVAAEVATVGARIVAIISRLFELASITGGAIVWKTADMVTGRLATILGKEVTVAAVTPAAGTVKSLTDIAQVIEASPWTLGNFPRGLKIESMLKDPDTVIPRGFPTIDDWHLDTGIARSIKSINLNAPTYQSISKLRRLLTRYVHKMANFKGARFDGLTVREEDILIRELQVAIPNGGSAEQLALIDEMTQYATDKGVSPILEVMN